jgi:peptidoglycan hydrolase-like protein with peptidoglycan-binding domain
VAIPENITVHLGPPNAEAENITLNFIDYVKNVASSELYPTWPESTLRANIHAIVSVALNRVFTEWYRTRGYNFDITNSTAYDQAFVPNRGFYDTISVIVDEIFDEYIVREGRVEPLFAQFCDGRISQCDGMYQWGSVDLASQGYSPIEILQYYYGNDITILTNAPVGSYEETFHGNLQVGDTGSYVQLAQLMLNTISTNFPALTRQPADAYFGPLMESVVEMFQGIFKLPVTGIIDKGTWYAIRNVHNAVTKLAELTSSGLLISNLPEEAIDDPRTYAQLIQFFINILSAYYPTIPAVDINGIIDANTNRAIIEFQKTMNLPETGIIDDETWDALYTTILGILNTLPPMSISLPIFLYPNYELGIGLESPSVYILKLYLSFLSTRIPQIPSVTVNNVFNDQTATAVRAFQNYYSLPTTGRVNEETWNRIVQIYRQLRFGNA